MLKYMSIILALAPACTYAHEWTGSEYWLERFMRNHNKIIECQLLVVENDIDTFRSTCSTWSLGYTENSAMAEYYAEWDTEHPELTQSQFVYDHFPEEYLVPLAQNLVIQDQLEALIISLFIVEGLTRDVGTKHITQGPSSAIDEDAGDDQIHEE